MNIKQRAVIGSLVVCGFIFFQVNGQSQKNSLTKDGLQGIIDTVEQSFEEAEKIVLGNEPVDPDTPSGPNPDVNKCICKGTGEILQGDGHITPCPYHAKTSSETCGCGCNKNGCSCQSEPSVRRRGLFGIFK